ncbi:MAG: 30S ribosomal protein S20 [Candidatus Rokubacteria bacterium]|nr:30S ribosomal protein S20 [Candidatus Rokubacteria bacterium]
MANIKSAKKRIRQNERRRLRNRAIRTRIRTAVKEARQALGAKAPAAPASIHEAIRILDKAVSKGVIHPNTAARRKAALARQLVH